MIVCVSFSTWFGAGVFWMGGHKKRPPTTDVAVVSLKTLVAESRHWVPGLWDDGWPLTQGIAPQLLPIEQN
jgi:hypothetical protein